MISTETPFYCNTGSCVHPYSVTCIEVEPPYLSLIKWYMDTKENGVVFVKREEIATLPVANLTDSINIS